MHLNRFICYFIYNYLNLDFERNNLLDINVKESKEM